MATHPESFVYKQYKGMDLELPLTDEMREFLVARSKDTLIAECDDVWNNFMNRPVAEPDVDEEDDFSYSDLTVKELVAEIEDRNKDRDPAEQMATTGNKGDLVARLEADDVENPDEG